MQPGGGGEAADTPQQQQPASLRVVMVRVPPHLVGQLSQDLVSQALIGQSSLDDVVPKQVLLSPIQVGVAHEPQDLQHRTTSLNT